MSSKRPQNISVVSSDRAFFNDLSRFLTADALHVQAEVNEESDLVVVDVRDGQLFSSDPVLSRFGQKAIVFTDHDDKDNVNLLLSRYDIRHLVGANGCDPIRELLITIKKIASNTVFGLDCYFGSEVAMHRQVVHDAESIKPVIEKLLSFLHLDSSFAALHEYLTLTSNELLTNAIYNAPVDQQGNPRYEKTDRRIKVKLESHEAVEMIVCENERSLGILVQDQFGRLAREKIVQHLMKCVNNTSFVDEKKGGAGAGIFLAFYTASQLIVNRAPGRRLEVICIIEKNKRYKDYRSRVTSFNYFEVMEQRVRGAA